LAAAWELPCALSVHKLNLSLAPLDKNSAPKIPT
jgi:hypothetical protein